jgi:hypothetical protein
MKSKNENRLQQKTKLMNFKQVETKNLPINEHDEKFLLPEENLSMGNSTLENEALHTDSQNVLYNLTRIIKDLETRRRDQEKMYRIMVMSEGRYRVIFSSSSDFAFSVKIIGSKKYGVEWASPWFEQEMGFSFSNLLDEDKCRNHIHQDDLNSFRNSLNGLCEGKISSNEIRLVKQGGETSWYQFLLYPTNDDLCNLIKFCGVCSNVSQKKRNEHELIDQNRDLEKRIQEYSVQLDLAVRNLQKEIDNRIIAENKLKMLEERFGLLIESNFNFGSSYNRKSN